LQATALRGPIEAITPTQTDFGDVAIGKRVAQKVTVSNHGDFPLQVQQAFMVSGTPSTFPITNDGCSGRSIAVASSCQFTVNFQPIRAGFREGSVIVITNTPAPVLPLGFTGTGVANPRGSATVYGNPAAGSRLTCHPAGYGTATSYSYRWLRNGHQVAGAIGASFTPGDGDVGARLACQVTASNSVGSQTVTSPATGPVAATDLSRLPGSFVDNRACRAVSASHRLTTGGVPITVSYSHPTVLWAPLTVSARQALRVSVDGQFVGSGKRVTVTPRALSGFSDGLHMLGITVRRQSTTTRLLLANCLLVIRVQGASRRSATVSVSARAAIGAASIRLPRGLSLHVTRHLLGQFSYTQDGYPPLTFAVVGSHTTVNDIIVILTRHRIRVTNLPARTGVIRLSFQRAILAGTGGTVQATAAVAGTPGQQTTRVRATWFRGRSA
jgi:hypothetical protein